ncbi:MAG: Mur ligase family protein, partial [Ignavibacteria bacterium]|nr:Mur ligase family protein [Ignavibacteria bacterium]
LYTSPHLVHFNERIRINGKPISSKKVASLVNEIYPDIENKKSTFFEATTAIAFKYFADEKVDIAIIETGLGGRLDATNVILPIVSVITTIGLEHTEILGNTIEKIAKEKAGIIKQNVPCITGVKSKKALEVINRVCKKNKSELIKVKDSEFKILRSSLEGLFIEFSCLDGKKIKAQVGLIGKHQARNAILAVRAVEIATMNNNYKVSLDAIKKGLRNVIGNSGIQARLSIVKKRPLVIMDVAHNPDGMKTLCSSLQKLTKKKFYVVFGIMVDKNYKKIVRYLRQIAKVVFVVKAKTERARQPEDVVAELKRLHIKADAYHDVETGLRRALATGLDNNILVTGSHFVVGEAIAFLNNEKYLTINQ